MPAEDSSSKKSGKKASAGGQDHRTKDPATERKDASTLLTELENVVGRMGSYRGSYKDMEGIYRENEQLKKSMNEKDAIIAEKIERINFLERKEKEDLETYGKEYSAFEKERAELKRSQHGAEEAARLRVEEEARKWTEKFQDEQARVAAGERKSWKLGKKNDKLTGKLQDWEKNLAILEVVNFEDFGEKVANTYKLWIEVVKKYFLADLPENFITDGNQWEKGVSHLGVDLPLAPSNTLEAKVARMTTALHILSNVLCDTILTPSYIPESDFASRALKEIQDDLYHVDEERERMVRGIILTLYKDEMDNAGGRAADAALDKAKGCLTLLTSDIDGFLGELRGVLVELLELWRKAQKSQKMVLATVESTEEENGGWISLEELGDPPKSSDLSQPTTIINLFPRIFAPGAGQTIHPGTAAWSTQGPLIAAQQEYERFKHAQEQSHQDAEKLKTSVLKAKLSGISGMFSGARRPRSHRTISLPPSPAVNVGQFPSEDLLGLGDGVAPSTSN